MVEMLRRFGAKVEWCDGGIEVDTTDVHPQTIGRELTGKMRASVLFLGPLLARFGEATTDLPGGCRIGERPIDWHLSGFEQLGYETKVEDEGVVHVWGEGKNRVVHLPGVSVGATENVMMASCTQAGASVLNAAREPEIVALGNALSRFGFGVTAGDSEVQIAGGKPRGGEVEIPSDRIVAGTWAAAFLATGGEGRIVGYPHKDLRAFTALLLEGGARLEEDGDALLVLKSPRLKALKFGTGAFPAFPTDLQPIVSALLTKARGKSRIVENLFESRSNHLNELGRMGARSWVDNRTFTIEGVKQLQGALVSSTDLRCGAALVVAALGACGETLLQDRHISRGYHGFIASLESVGAQIEVCR